MWGRKCWSSTLTLLVVVLTQVGSAGGTVSWDLIGVGTSAGIVDVAISPTSKDVLYICSDFGGPYKSCDGGQTWEAITNGILCTGWRHAGTTGSFVIHPTHPDTLYKGGKFGLFKSIDGGDSWTLKWGQQYYMAARVAIDRGSPETVYLTSGFRYMYENLFKKSTDGGETWVSRVDSLPGNMNILAIEVDPSTHDVFIGTNKGVFWSEDGDSAWVYRSSGLPDSSLIMQFLVQRNNAIYPLALRRYGALQFLFFTAAPGTIYASTNAGQSWDTLACNLLPKDRDFDYIKAHPDHPDTLYVTDGEQIYRSVNRGGIWRLLVDGMPYDEGGDPVVPKNRWAAAISICEADPHTILAGRFLSTDNGSTWACVAGDSMCAGSTYWRTKGVAPMAALAVAVRPGDSDDVFLGYADVGVQFSNDGGTCCEHRDEGLDLYCLGEDATAIAIDDSATSTVYAAIWHCFSGSETKYGRLFKSTDSGENWTKKFPSGPDHQEKITTIALGTEGGAANRTVYIGVENKGVFRSSDAGENWSDVTNNLGACPAIPDTNLLITRITVEPGSDDHVFVSVKTDYKDSSAVERCYGGVWKTTNGGTTWTRAPADTNPIPCAHDIAMHPITHSTLYAGVAHHVDWYKKDMPGSTWHFYGGVYKSLDGGLTWTNKYEDPWVDAVSINPDRPRIVLAGCRDFQLMTWQKDKSGVYSPTGLQLDCGVIRSGNGGTSWSKVNSGLDHRNITFLTHDPNDGQTVYAAICGGGIFKATDTYIYPQRTTPPPSPTRVRGDGIPEVHFINQNIPNPFNPVTEIAYGVPRAGAVDITIYNVLGQRVIRLVEGHHEPGVYRILWDGTNANGQAVTSGVYFCRMTTDTFEKTRRLVLMR